MEVAVERVDAAGAGVIRGEQPGLSLVDSEAGVDGSGCRRLDERVRTGIPRRDRAVQVRKDEMSKSVVPAVSDREGCGIAVGHLTRRPLRPRRCCWYPHKAAWRVYVNLADVRTAS